MKFYVNQETYDKLLTTINKLKEAIRNAEHDPITGEIYHIEQYEAKIKAYEDVFQYCEVLTEEDNWNFRIRNNEGEYLSDTWALPSYVSSYLQKQYPNGVLIKNLK